MAGTDWKLMEMDEMDGGNCWPLLEMDEMAGNGWKWQTKIVSVHPPSKMLLKLTD